MKKCKVLVLTGDGINCEIETAKAFTQASASVDIVPISDLEADPQILNRYHILALPGGFSFGDEIGSGQVLALKLKYSLGLELRKFIEDKKLILGICNGFQTLVRLGLLPKPMHERTITLTHNEHGHFINKWTDLKIEDSNCIWTKNLTGQIISLPIRHGEGRLKFSGNEQNQKQILKELESHKQIALRYSENVNGSMDQIAGLCDPSGRIFGLMPHPEAALSNWLLPDGKSKNADSGLSLQIFTNAVNYVEEYL